MVRVASCAWISSPMTVSHSMAALTRMPAAGAGASRSCAAGVRDGEQPLFGEVRTDDLQADRQAAPTNPHGTEMAGSPARLAAIV